MEAGKGVSTKGRRETASWELRNVKFQVEGRETKRKARGGRGGSERGPIERCDKERERDQREGEREERERKRRKESWRLWNVNINIPGGRESNRSEEREEGR